MFNDVNYVNSNNALLGYYMQNNLLSSIAIYLTEHTISKLFPPVTTPQFQAKVIQLRSNRACADDAVAGFELQLATVNGKTMSLDKFVNGAIGYAAQFLRDKEKLGLQFKEACLKYSLMPVNHFKDQDGLDVLYRYLAEFYVTNVIDGLETAEAMAVTTIGV